MLFAGAVVVDAFIIIEEGAVVVDGDRIVAAGAHTDLIDRYPDHERREFGIVALGLVGGHAHSVQSLGGGIADDTELLGWLLDHVSPIEAGPDAEGMYVVAELGYLEYIESGTTTVVDRLSVRHAEKAFEAAGEMGIRGRIGKVLMDTNAPEGPQEGTDVGFAESERPIGRYHDGLDRCIQYAVTPRFVVTCFEACLWGARDLADRYDGIHIHTHASESRSEIETIENETGMRNIHWLDGIDLTSDDAVLAHCVHIDDPKRDMPAKAGTYATCYPSSSMKLASGIAPTPDYLDRGINVALDNDGPPCNNTPGPSAKMRQASFPQKVNVFDPMSMPVTTVFEMVTRSGAKAAGFDRVDELREGWKTNVVGIDVGRTRATPFHDVLSHLVFAAHDNDVVFIMADSDAFYDKGEHVRANTDDTRKRAWVVADGPDSAPTSD